jgi:hypothetical protein
VGRYNVDVFLDQQWIATKYNIDADSQAEAEELVSETLELDFSAEQYD